MVQTTEIEAREVQKGQMLILESGKATKVVKITKRLFTDSIILDYENGLWSCLNRSEKVLTTKG